MKQQTDLTPKQKLTQKLISLRDEAERKGIQKDLIRRVFCDNKLCSTSYRTDKHEQQGSDSNAFKGNRQTIVSFASRIINRYTFILIFVIGVISAIAIRFVFGTELPRCMVQNNEISIEMSRPLADCSVCRNLHTVPIEHGISAQDFRRKYAYTSVPVLIKDVTSHWSAMTNFTFQYFKQLYQGTDGALASVDEECQFFPYKTDFSSLSDVFNMTDARANFANGEQHWYIGWSNCHKEVKEELRKHYERPYFLPSDSESSNLDWIFMGGSGPGALIHIDYVQKPSWQAQISGKKTWTLIPPPECEAECRALNVTVHKGDIFVVDTNLWYHSTFIHPGEISITIGSEYD